MANFYVNKSGSDSNGGTSSADAWLTIQHGVDNITSSDKLIVQSGVYEENVDISGTCEIEGDGYVVMDGSTISGLAFDVYGDIEVTVDGFLIRNYNGFFDCNRNSFIHFNNCYIKDCMDYRSTMYYARNSPATSFDFANNTIFDNTLVWFRYLTDEKILIFNNCSFLGSGDMIKVDRGSGTGKLIMGNCHLEGDINLADGAEIQDLDYNNIRGSIIYMATTYATLSDFQNAYPDLASHSINEDGDFNNDYTPRWSSPNIGAGKTGTDIGARGPASYFESTDELFEGANLTNVSRNANGDFELDGGATTGTVVSAVLDFGSDITLGNLRMESNEDYPADVIDSDVDDSEPNRANYEYRSATEAEGSFLQGDATPSWNEAERGDDLSLTCRYFQVRITLRSNGVAA